MRVVSNEEFTQAYACEDNIKIINHVLKRFTKLIDYEERQELGQVALWRHLRSWKEGLGLSFSSSLYNYVTWECLAHLRERDPVLTAGVEYTGVHASGSYQDFTLTFLDDDCRKPIEQRIIGRMSFREMAEENGRGKETERLNWLRIIKKLREDFGD